MISRGLNPLNRLNELIVLNSGEHLLYSFCIFQSSVLSALSVLSVFFCVALGNASVLSMLEDRVYMPKDTVVMYDDFPDGMYFIDNGVLGVYSQTDELLAELSEGSFFGEIALLLNRKRSASVLALTWCNVKMLSKTNFDSVLKGKKSHCCRIVVTLRCMAAPFFFFTSTF